MATLRATTSFDAPGRFVTAGEELDASDPIVKGRESLFEATSAGAPAAKAPAKRAPAKKAAPKAKG